MAGRVVNIYEAKTALSRLVDLASGGSDVVIAKAGVPKVRLVPVRKKRAPRKPGIWKGKIWIADDFDAPVPVAIQSAFEDADDST